MLVSQWKRWKGRQQQREMVGDDAVAEVLITDQEIT